MRYRTLFYLLLVVSFLSLSIAGNLEGTAKTPLYTGMQPPDPIDDLMAKTSDRTYWHPALRDIQTVEIIVKADYTNVEGLSLPFDTIALNALPVGLQGVIGRALVEDAKLTITATCSALGKDYPEGFLYTGALVEGKITLEAKNFKAEEDFKGELKPPSELPNDIKANAERYKDPKSAPFFKAIVDLPGSYVDKLARMFYKAFGIYNLCAIFLRGDPIYYAPYKSLDPLLYEIGEPLLEPFTYLLKSRLEGVQIVATLALTAIKSPKAIPALLSPSTQRIWRDTEFDDALKTLGNEPGGVEQLLACLKDKDPAVRAKSAEILRFVGGDKAVEGLISALEDKNVDVRKTAAISLFCLKDKIKNKKSIDALIKVVQNPYEDEDVLIWVVRTLGELKDPRAIEPLDKAMRRSETSRELQQEIEQALKKIPSPPVPLEQAFANWRSAVEHRAGPGIQQWEKALKDYGKRAVDLLLPIVRNPKADKDLRISALRVLSQIKDDRPYTLYLKIAKDEKESLIARSYAIRGLGNCPTKEASDFLIDLLTKRTAPEELRSASAYALGEKREKRAIEHLYFALSSRSVRKIIYLNAEFIEEKPLFGECARALVKIGEPAIDRIKDALNSENLLMKLNMLEALGGCQEQWAQALISSALQDPSPEVRLWAVKYFLEKKKENDSNLFNTLISILEDELSPSYVIGEAFGLVFPFIRQGNMEEEKRRLGEAVVKYLNRIKSLKYTSHYEIEEAFFILGELKDPSYAEAIAPFLRSKDDIVRETAMEALASIGQAGTALDDLIYISKNDPKPDIRRQAVVTLGKIKDPRGLNAIIDALKYDPEDTVQIGAYEALLAWNTPEMIEPLAAYLPRCQDKIRREEIAEILVKTDRERAGKVIIPLLQDKEPRVRASAAEALGLLKSWAGVEPLIELLTDEDARVRESALKALREIAHDSFGYDVGRWRVWWEGKKEELLQRGELK